jgi:hypothetical protein
MFQKPARRTRPKLLIRSVGNKAIVLFQNQLFLRFSNSPDLATGILNAIMDAFSAHSASSRVAMLSAEQHRVEIGRLTA